ncbi:MAG: hypothetical protein JW733_00635 [Coriobacteriia bacterium]|nr:hypothetical protein [Coriobacteriia bacterium]MBN2840214.1 hypothetical protein [Coriobacteriia bacterium]
MGLAEFVGMLSRRWLLIVLAGVVAAAAAFIVGGHSAAPLYSPQAEVLVREGLSDAVVRMLPSYMRDFNRDWNTRVAGLQSVTTAEAAIEAGGFTLEPAGLADRVQVSTDGSTGFVTVSVSDTDPQIAASLTNAITAAYATSARADQEAALGTAIAAAEERLAAAAERIVKLNSTLTGNPDDYPGDAAYSNAAAVLDSLTLGAATQVDPVVIVSEATAPTAAATGGVSDRLKTVLFGLLAGLALGVVFALVLEYLNRSRNAGPVTTV